MSSRISRGAYQYVRSLFLERRHHTFITGKHRSTPGPSFYDGCRSLNGSLDDELVVSVTQIPPFMLNERLRDVRNQRDARRAM